ncbi:hypothetical protein QBC35DRAFT_451287 [Podospora australis]|uniref:CPAF-like PDZ domain-containing protein n=1 Tax=Podospora australis TaxID=1536484 RepID=A0AAN6WYP7_9PEZI|nr:hypothetical protein QBC35DRAFT_451287 [Podospora australis]
MESAREFCSAFTATSLVPTSIPSFAAAACTAQDETALTSRVSSACSCFPSSVSSTAATATSTASNTAACAIVSSSWSAQKAANPSAMPTVAAALAHACLKSVPLGKSAAIELVESIQPYLEWQSDAAYKADPPNDYFFPPYNVFEALAKVKDNLKVDNYANEYAFREDLYLSVVKNVISSSIFCVRCQVHQRHRRSDLRGRYYLQGHVYQDPDAAYNNSMFYEKAYVAVGSPTGYFAKGGRIRFVYPGPNTTFTFENGTALTLGNLASVKVNMSGVTDGAYFYFKFCNPNGFIDSASSSGPDELPPRSPSPATSSSPATPNQSSLLPTVLSLATSSQTQASNKLPCSPSSPSNLNLLFRIPSRHP